MSKLIERAKDHYKGLLNQPKIISVPEWSSEGEKTIIYSTPLTLSERAKLKRFAGDSDPDLAAEIVIMKAKDKDGNSYFTREDKLDLMKSVDSAVIARIAADIMGADDDKIIEDMEKN